MVAPLDRLVLKETPFQQFMDRELAEKWAGIPHFSENDPLHPEWRATPVIPLDLRADGYGMVYVKNEADTGSNPTGTIKDRKWHEIGLVMRDFGLSLLKQRRLGNLGRAIETIPVPILSVISAGNDAAAGNHVAEKYSLPPIHVLVDRHVPHLTIDALLAMPKLNVYMAGLRDRPFTAQDILAYTNNTSGLDLTSLRIFQPHIHSYDWHVYETFNENPTTIMVPHGSGMIGANYLTHQAIVARNATRNAKDPRLQSSPADVASMSVMMAKPERDESVADKLAIKFNPFEFYGGNDVTALKQLGMTGSRTGIYNFSEEQAAEAWHLMNRKGIPAEPSGAAGLALYLTLFKNGMIKENDRPLVINTGKGI